MAKSSSSPRPGDNFLRSVFQGEAMYAWALLLQSHRSSSVSSDPPLLSQPPSLFIYPVSSNPAAALSAGKGNVPRRPSVTEPCVRAL